MMKGDTMYYQDIPDFTEETRLDKEGTFMPPEYAVAYDALREEA